MRKNFRSSKSSSDAMSIALASPTLFSPGCCCKVVETVASILGLPEIAAKVVLIVLLVGFPIALLFAWAYELTPDGIKREKDVDRSESITNDTGQRLDRITIAVVVIAVGILLVDRFFLADAPSPTQVVSEESIDSDSVAAEGDDDTPSIAVLPFVNMSNDENSAYFSDGLADTMLHMLAQVREIRVAARTSSFQFRDQTMDVGKIGEQLNVGTILEGSVQRAGDKIRVTAQLIDVENGFHLWSGNFDRNLEDVFAIQDEIAGEVVAALKVSLLGDVLGTMDHDQTDNIDAYTEFLLGINDLSQTTTESLTNAVAHLQAATEHDPKFARGWSTLGRVYVELDDYGLLGRSEAIELSRDAATRALNLAPDSSEALAVLGMADLLEGNIDESRQLLEKAIEIGPNDLVALTYYSFLLGFDAKPDERIALAQQVIRLDPLSEQSHLNLATAYLGVSRFAEAREAIAKLRALYPDSPNVASFASSLAYELGEIAEAIREMRFSHELDSSDPEQPFMLGLMYLSIDMPVEAKQWMDRATEIDAEHPVSQGGPLFLNYYSQENNAENARLARRLLDEKIEDRRNVRFVALQVMLDHAADTGEYGPILDVLDTLYPHLFDDPAHDLDKSYMGVYVAGIALLGSGNTERGTELLSWWRDEIIDYEEIYGVGRASVAVSTLLDYEDEAITKLGRYAAESQYGWEFNRMLLQHSASLEPIRDDPKFTSLLESYRENAAEQRQLLQAMNED